MKVFFNQNYSLIEKRIWKLYFESRFGRVLVQKSRNLEIKDIISGFPTLPFFTPFIFKVALIVVEKLKTLKYSF